MNGKRIFVTAAAVFVLAAGSGTAALASATPSNANPGTVVSIRVLTKCVSESEHETVYEHVKDGSYTPYVPPKHESTASENYPTRCTTKTTINYEK